MNEIHQQRKKDQKQTSYQTGSREKRGFGLGLGPLLTLKPESGPGAYPPVVFCGSHSRPTHSAPRKPSVSRCRFLSLGKDKGARDTNMSEQGGPVPLLSPTGS